MTFRGLSQDIVETIIDVNNGQATQTYDQAGNSEYDIIASSTQNFDIEGNPDPPTYSQWVHVVTVAVGDDSDAPDDASFDVFDGNGNNIGGDFFSVSGSDHVGQGSSIHTNSVTPLDVQVDLGASNDGSFTNITCISFEPTTNVDSITKN
jgi:hypothetical protein